MESTEESENSKSFRSENDKMSCSTSKCNTMKSSNIVHKLFNREIFGSTSRKSNDRNRKMFERIPPRLRFCLMDIVPMSYLREHVFMGFSQCGQFLLSFTYNCNTQVYFRESSKFTLHFLSWVPGCVVKPVHSVPLFGDDVDSKVTISMAQWKHNPGVLVVYGIADSCSERSYLSVIGVPRLGCKKCAAYSKDEDELNCGKRCLEHNFAIHTKFFCTSDSSMYEPVVQLAYSNQIIIYTDFIHILEVDLVKPDPERTELLDDSKYSLDRDETNSIIDTNPSTPASDVSAPFQSPKYQNNVVQNILADFSDLEVEPYQMSRPVQLPDVMGQELCIQASSISHNLMEEWEGPSPSIRTLISPPLRSPRRRPAESMSRFNEMHRIIAEKAYEFVEETEPKCEKLSIYRKRRLADKKYEFSEDNNENIVPFRVLRSNRKVFIGSTSKNPPRRPKSPPVESVVLRAHNQISRPPSPTTSCEIKNSAELSSLESDHNSESEYRVMEMLDDGSLKTVSVHDNASKTLSDFPVSPQDPYLVHSGNSKCSKFFTRYFVESDDEITSIITDSEDDCLSGYHVALHLSAHGARYAPLQALGAAAWERRAGAPAAGSLRARQRSLDTELLCNEVCGRLCRLGGKRFIYCFDWGCHVIDVCHSSGCLSGLCAMWLWASDEDGEAAECEACGDRAGCLLHRHQYAAECLFVWDLVTGVYRTERVAMTEDSSQEGSRVSGADRARELAKKLGPINMPPGNENRLLTTLTGRSLKRLTDVDNCIEITKNHPDSSESESSSDEESDSD
ncbi:uncharacterized protein LOC131846994 [Achroia grisella]|uniref:uncharacterized protein LOC131846994 n=1 Tax=Achroia grisella TaxID=688607 RepID=UPI0027D21979|nr:uncharacterized protein LOC131846994 [Achroia grisella]